MTVNVGECVALKLIPSLPPHLQFNTVLFDTAYLISRVTRMPRPRLVTNQVEIGRWLMACRFEVLLNAGIPADGPDVAMEALDIAEHLELLLSVYKPTSEFSRINHATANSPVTVSAATLQMIQLGLAIREETKGAFDLCAAELTELWGFSRRQGHVPSTDRLRSAVESIAANEMVIDEVAKTIQKTRSDVKINSGGIGKGFALDKMAACLKNHDVDSFLLHGGHSSILAAGHRLDVDSQVGWRIAVRHPEQAQRIIGELRLENTGLGTSGPANQYFYFNGVRYGHIIDPRSGVPVGGMLSITVLNPSAARADALATGLFVLGLDAAIEYCHQFPETGFLAILPAKKQGDVEIVTCNLSDEAWKSFKI